MITFLLIGMTLIILILQFAVAPGIAQYVYLHYTFDAKLAEPGEKISFTGKLINNWFLPIVYLNFYEYMPEGAVIDGQKGNYERHSLFLLPHHSYSNRISFTLPKRGLYKLGKYYVETGDYLGFKSWVKSAEIKADITVMPRQCTDEIVLKVLGGYIGDISVRRFILEDPVLTMGYLDYTGREPMKKISWKHSAKVGKLMVKNSDYTVDADAVVVLNLASGNVREKEKSLEIVRTVCEKLEQEHIPYQFVSNGDTGNLEEGFGRKHIDQLMMNLGRSRLFAHFSFELLVDRCIRERKRSRSYFIISEPLSDEERKALIRLQQYSDYELCVLEAEVREDDAC